MKYSVYVFCFDLYLIVTYRATSLYTTQTLVRNSTDDLTEADVMLVGTDDGKILKIVMTYNGTNHVPLISEEFSVSVHM